MNINTIIWYVIAWSKISSRIIDPKWNYARAKKKTKKIADNDNHFFCYSLITHTNAIITFIMVTIGIFFLEWNHHHHHHRHWFVLVINYNGTIKSKNIKIWHFFANIWSNQMAQKRSDLTGTLDLSNNEWLTDWLTSPMIRSKKNDNQCVLFIENSFEFYIHKQTIII